MKHPSPLWSALAFAAACSSGDPADSGEADAQVFDAGPTRDAGGLQEGGLDAGTPDASSEDASVDSSEPLPTVGLDARPVNTTCLAPTVGEDMPPALSATGCFQAEDPSVPLPSLIPFDLNAALWSDGSSKKRWMALPDGATVSLGDDGDFLFPPGTMLVKEFSLEGRRLETRFMVHHPASEAPVDDAGTPSEPSWVGYTYQWNEEQTDALLVPFGPTTPFDIDGAGPSETTWQVPTRADCMTCHTQVAGFSLGPEIGQLNRDFTYPSTGRTANQLLTLEHIGVLAQPLAGPLNTLLRFVPYDNNPDPEATLNDKARSYLHVNCSMCHRKPGTHQSAGMAPDDFRATVPFQEMGICNETPRSTGPVMGLGMNSETAKILVPMDPDNSVFWRRMSSRPNYQMPPLGTTKVDEQGANLLKSWINTIASCTDEP